MRERHRLQPAAVSTVKRVRNNRTERKRETFSRWEAWVRVRQDGLESGMDTSGTGPKHHPAWPGIPPRKREEQARQNLK